MEADEVFGLSSFDELPSDDREIFDLILELAFRATVVQPRQVFSHHDVQNFFQKQSSSTSNDESSLGLVVVDRYFVKCGLKEIYTFLHLTFQEFLAACHIVRLNSKNQRGIISKYGGDDKLGVVWKFYCGMTQFSNEEKKIDFKKLFEKTQSNVLLQLHCAHESQQNILCTHVTESYDSTIILDNQSLNPADFTALGYLLTHSNVPTTKLAITSCCIGPEGLSALVKAIESPLKSLKALSFQNTKIKLMIPEFCCVLKECPELSRLVIAHCDVSKNPLSEMSEMLPALESLEELDLSYNPFGKTAKEAFKCLLSNFPKLKKILVGRKSFDAFVIVAINGRDIEFNLVNEKSESSKQELLRLRGLNSKDVGPFSTYLQTHPCFAALIKELNLQGNKIGDDGAQALGEGLQHCTNLQELSLDENNIDAAGAQAVAGGLQHCTNLQTLNLYGNNISAAGAQAVAGALQHCISLQTLNLMQNNIGATGAQALGEGLQHCTNLQKLGLWRNNVGDAGAQAVVEGLQHCTNLQYLSLGDNSLTDSSVGSLSQLIRTAKQLKKLLLGSSNRFTADGKRSLRAAAEERKSNPDCVELDLYIN